MDEIPQVELAPGYWVEHKKGRMVATMDLSTFRGFPQWPEWWEMCVENARKWRAEMDAKKRDRLDAVIDQAIKEAEAGAKR